MNPPMPNPMVNNVIPNNGFGNYPMLNIDNPQYFQNGTNSFGDNPYSMIFNQFQNAASVTANQASS